MYDHYLAPIFRRKIREFKGLKIQFVQDDYRSVDALCAQTRYMGIDILFTLVPESEYERIWTPCLPGVKLITYLAGYVPNLLIGLQVPPLAERPIDVGYRGRVYPYWLGKLAYEKVQIGEQFLSHAAGTGLVCDIKWCEEDRLYGEAWDRFNRSCRVMLGCGSGASIADFDGSVERAVRKYLRLHPEASFEEVSTAILQPYEGNIHLDVISPRHFEAIAAGTALVLFTGAYSGILKPWIHYIPLERDFSNFAEVVRKIRDISFLEEMTHRAYQDVIASGNYSYRRFMEWFDAIVAQYRKPDHHALPLKISYKRMNFLSTNRFRVAYIKARNKVESGAPVRLKWRFHRKSYLISMPFYRVQYFALVRLNAWRWQLFYRLNYVRWWLFYQFKHSIYLGWAGLHMAATIPHKTVTFSRLLITNAEARQILKLYLTSPKLRRNGQFARVLKAMAKGKVPILSS